MQHFCHLTPKPAGYPYPYPHFVWLIYIADAVEQVPDARVNDNKGIIEASFLPITEALTLALSSEERLLLQEAVRVRSGPDR